MHSLSTVCGTVGPPSLSRGKVGVVLLDFDFGNLLRDWISTLQTSVFYESMCIRLCNGILSANMQISYAGNIDRACAGLQRAVLRSGRTAEDMKLFFAQEVSRGCFETPWS